MRYAPINANPHPPPPGHKWGFERLLILKPCPRGGAFVYSEYRVLHAPYTYTRVICQNICPPGSVFFTPSVANPHPCPGGGGWGFALIGALVLAVAKQCTSKLSLGLNYSTINIISCRSYTNRSGSGDENYSSDAENSGWPPFGEQEVKFCG